MIDSMEIHHKVSKYYLHVQNHVLGSSRHLGWTQHNWSIDEGSCCEGLIPEVAKSSKALPKWAGFLSPMIWANDGLSLPSSWLPTPPTIEGSSHSNHKNIKVLVEAFESWLYSPQSMFDTLRSQYCQLLCYVGTFRSHPALLQQQGVCHTAALPFRLNSILRQKQHYGNSNISPCKNIIFQKPSKRNQNPSRYYDDSITNLKFQHKPKYHLSKILI